MYISGKQLFPCKETKKNANIQLFTGIFNYLCHMKRILITFAMCCGMTAALAQQYQVPVSERLRVGEQSSGIQHEKMQSGKYEPTWESLETHQTPEWFRNAKFGIWAHWGVLSHFSRVRLFATYGR